ncbi:hypothetical protein [Pseudomonas sp. 9Ag]|uniref:hypothetical protein n=1 Tax=Pseudomonas sp. 9Ag TaxID=2653167 RepID=UPI0012F24785|nr:hypothetical protein [Pseudomonas sp. 9Ag]VXC43376.1 hypothetical protein PSEUDO9AG_30149 [Pseudomonas sp. 9Ag]
MKHVIWGVLLIVVAGLLNNLVNLRDEENRIAVENLNSYGDCLLPHIRGTANWVGDGADQFCNLIVLPGGYDTVGENCHLRTYSLSGVPAKERYRINQRWFADEYQLQEVCRVHVAKRDFEYLASKMQGKDLQPSIKIASGPVTLKAGKERLKFSIALSNDISPERVKAAATQLEAVANEYFAYFERPAKEKRLEVMLSREPIPEEERFPFTIASAESQNVWRFNGLDVLRDRDHEVLGMPPAQRKYIFSRLLIETARFTDNFKRDADTNRFSMVMYRDQYVTNDPTTKLLTKLSISSEQLKYVSEEGRVLGWGSEIIDNVPESLRSVSFVKPSD